MRRNIPGAFSLSAHECQVHGCFQGKQGKQCTYNVTLRRVRAATVAMEKQRVLHYLSVCICGHKYPACAVMSSVAFPYVQYFSALSHERYDFRGEKKLLNTKCVF